MSCIRGWIKKDEDRYEIDKRRKKSIERRKGWKKGKELMISDDLTIKVGRCFSLKKILEGFLWMEIEIFMGFFIFLLILTIKI